MNPEGGHTLWRRIMLAPIHMYVHILVRLVVIAGSVIAE